MQLARRDRAHQNAHGSQGHGAPDATNGGYGQNTQRGVECRHAAAYGRHGGHAYGLTGVKSACFTPTAMAARKGREKRESSCTLQKEIPSPSTQHRVWQDRDVSPLQVSKCL